MRLRGENGECSREQPWQHSQSTKPEIRNSNEIQNSKMTISKTNHSLLHTMAPKMFINSVASRTNDPRVFSKDSLPAVSSKRNQYRLSLASLREILMCITKSFLLSESFAST